MRPNATIPRTCEYCGKPFDALVGNVNKGFGRFCKRSCANKGRRKRPVTVRFWERVDTSGDCWLWTGKTVKGYGHLAIDGKMHRAHRVSWELHHGPIPDGMDVLHTCDNPTCVNPKHLFLGTHADNMRDMRIKQRASWGERSVLAKLTEDQVREIRQRYATGLVTQRALGSEYGVTHSTIKAIVNHKTWRHLDS